MSPFSWPVLAGTLLVGSPALYAAQVADTLSPDVAVVRLLLCALGVWAVCSAVASLAGDTVAANTAATTLATEAANAEVEVDMQRPAGVDS